MNGDCLEKLKELDDNSIDSVVTDPPYGLAFMGKAWDYDLPPIEVWKECLRVLKPGGFLLSFGGSRTYHRLAVLIEDAGFEIRDQIMWVYGSGFPKSHNVGKKLAEWEGWGTALKPAHEPIVMARKPFKETVAKNVLKYGTGAINIDASKIPFDMNGAGRFPANFIHDGSQQVLDLFPDSKGGAYPAKRGPGFFNNFEGQVTPGGARVMGDKGSAARFFYCAKANKKDRGEGNTHPTVKPQALMAYLCRLVTQPGGVILDPFMGSGTTGKAADAEGFDFIGIERDPDYYEIARRRCG